MRLTSRYKFFITCTFILSMLSKEALADNVCISPSDTNESIVIFLNGITNEDSDSKSSKLLLEKKLSSTGVCNSNNNCVVDRFWNETDHGLNDHIELIYVGAIEKLAADIALSQLTRTIRNDHEIHKKYLSSTAFDTQAYDEIDALMIQQLDTVENTLVYDTLFGEDRTEEALELTIPFDEIGSKVTKWLSSYIQENENSIKITSPYQSLLLSEMGKKEFEYDALFKQYFLKELSTLYFSYSELYENNEDRSYAFVAINKTVDELALVLEGHIKNGKKVVVVAHSQGNHIIELAYGSLVEKLGDYVKDVLQVVGVASVASTTPNNSYITWNADQTVLTAHNAISLSPPLAPNFSSTTDYVVGLSWSGANHSFEKVYMNPDLKGKYIPQPNEDTTELDIYIQNNLEYSIDDIVSGLVDRALKNSKPREFKTDFTFSIPEGQDESTKARLFDATGSGHTDDPIEGYGWNWGDGSTILTSNSPITSHEYAEYGTYEVTLAYTTKCGVSNAVKKEVYIGYSLDKPTNLTAVRNGDSISFTWDSVDGADGYDFYLTEELFDGSVTLSDGVVKYTPTDTSITLPALDKNTIYFVVVRPRREVLGGKHSDVLRVELQGVVTETLSIPATLSREEGKNKFVPFTFTPIELKDKVDHVSCTTNPDIGSLFGTASIQGVSFIAPAVNDVTSFIIKCAAYEKPDVLLEIAEPLVVSNNLVVTVTQTVVINNPPVAKITTDKSLPTLVEGDSFNLKGDTSTDPDTGDSITAYSWIEGGTEIGTNAILPLNNIIAGTRTISLTVTDNGANGGLTNTTDVTFTVKEKPNTIPVARITSDTDLTNVFEGDSVILKGDTSTDAEGAIKSYLWEELGQSIGTSSTVSLPNLTLGKHFIKLTVTDSQDATHSHQITIDAKEKVIGTSFIVPADLEQGTQFTAPEGVTSCTFTSNGLWTIWTSHPDGSDVIFYDAEGSSNLSHATNRVSQNSSPISLIIRRDDGSFEDIGKSKNISVQPSEVIYFLLNDNPNGYADNQGQQTVTWECNNLESGLVAHYEFEDNANDSTINANHGTENGSVTYVDGVKGKAGNFDGNSVIRIDGFLDTSGDTDISISFWIKPDANNNIGGLVTQHSACDGYDDFFHITLYNNNNYDSSNLEADIFNSDRVRIPSSEINTDWHKVDFIYVEGGYKFYLDGILKDSILTPVSPNNIMNNSLKMAIGGFDSDSCSINHNYNGLIDELRIYDRALTSEEVTALYQLDNITTATGNLNDTGITQCADNSSNNLACPVSTHPNQDAQSGRDVTHNDDSDGHAGFSFTKISNTGAELPASATEWSCVKDNVTGLTWEVKTDDGGLHDKDNTYTWYNPNQTTNGGMSGAGITKTNEYLGDGLARITIVEFDANANYSAAMMELGKWGETILCSLDGLQASMDPAAGLMCNSLGNINNSHQFTNDVNAENFCGATDWRMPNIEELSSIIDYGMYYPNLSFNSSYFNGFFLNNHLEPAAFWTTTPYANGSPPNGMGPNGTDDYQYSAWLVDFRYGRNEPLPTYNDIFVRLVRSN